MKNLKIFIFLVVPSSFYIKNEQLQNFIAKPYIKYQFLEAHTNAINNFIHILDGKKENNFYQFKINL